jgi:hypothetical protein
MSTDNYSKCPKCKIRIEKEKANVMEKARLSYGKVSEDEYNNLIAKATNAIEIEETLREDYEFCLDGEWLNIDYVCSCSECDFNYQYDKNINIIQEQNHIQTILKDIQGRTE